MVICCSKIGQLGNRLTHMANLCANALAYGYDIVYPYFDEYAVFFENFETQKYVQLSPTHKNKLSIASVIPIHIYRKVCHYICRILKHMPLYPYVSYKNNAGWWTEHYDMNNAQFVHDAKTRKLLLQGWLFRDYQHVEAYHDEICRLFQPKSWILEEAKKSIIKANARGGVIGVHIRRGDYATYQNGKWFYDNKTYRSFIRQLLIQIPNARFIVCSNEDIDRMDFQDLPVIIEKRHFMVDLYILSMCDYIIGPPSTFTNWASYVGNVPLLKVFDKEQPIKLERFEIRKSI